MTTAQKAPTTATTATTATQTAPTATSPTPPPASGGKRRRRGHSQTPPGSGGTIPAHSDVMLAGRGGRIVPPGVNVAPFVAIDVTLVSTDGAAYSLSYSGHRLTVGPGKRTAKLSLPGIRPGQTYVLTGKQGRVIIASGGEPGP